MLSTLLTWLCYSYLHHRHTIRFFSFHASQNRQTEVHPSQSCYLVIIGRQASRVCLADNNHVNRDFKFEHAYPRKCLLHATTRRPISMVSHLSLKCISHVSDVDESATRIISLMTSSIDSCITNPISTLSIYGHGPDS